MKNALTVFTTPADLGSFAIRVSKIDGQPWFVTTDVARALGRGSAVAITRGLPDDEKGQTIILTPGGPQTVGIVSESGLYRILMRSHSPNARPVQDWLAREVLPAIRKDGMYVMGEEKVRTGEMSEDEMTLLVLRRLQNKVERITAERDQFANENLQLTARNAVLEHLRAFVTVDAYLAEEGLIDGKYKSWQERKNIGIRAAAIARKRGIPLKKEDRWIRKSWGPVYAPVNVYPREILAEACAQLGYVKRVVALAA
jgi:prophage antirepressor-like protein